MQEENEGIVASRKRPAEGEARGNGKEKIPL